MVSIRRYLGCLKGYLWGAGTYYTLCITYDALCMKQRDITAGSKKLEYGLGFVYAGFPSCLGFGGQLVGLYCI